MLLTMHSRNKDAHATKEQQPQIQHPCTTVLAMRKGVARSASQLPSPACSGAGFAPGRRGAGLRGQLLSHPCSHIDSVT